MAIPNHEEIDDTYKMVNEAFFEGFDVAEKRYRLLIETIEELDEKLSASVEVGEWIPCSERLPKEEKKHIGYVLMQDTNTSVDGRITALESARANGDGIYLTLRNTRR